MASEAIAEMELASITFVILAGGAATRLDGRDKGLERLGGQPLVTWVVSAIGRMNASARKRDLLIVANRNIDIYSQYAVTISDDTEGFRGPLAGIATALRASQTTWLLTLPVDCPRPPSDLAERLLVEARSTGAAAVVVHDGERRQPLFALYRCELAGSATAVLGAEQGVWQWQTSIGARELDFSDRRRQFRNLNTCEEFAAYVAEHQFDS